MFESISLPSLSEIPCITNTSSSYKIFACIATLGVISTACLYHNEIIAVTRSELEKCNIFSSSVVDEDEVKLVDEDEVKLVDEDEVKLVDEEQ